MRYAITLSFAFFTLFTRPVLCAAQGWNDYSLQIDPGFEIIRANAIDVDLRRSGSTLVYYHGDYPGVGPIDGYAVTPTYIFTRHQGRVPRNLFAGDSFENVDPSRTFYFVVDKVAARTPGKFGFSRNVKIDGVPANDGRPVDVLGPFDEQTFRGQQEVQGALPIKWVKPRNPDVATPFIGSLAFLILSAFLFGWPIALLLWLGIIVYIIWRRRSRNHPTAG